MSTTDQTAPARLKRGGLFDDEPAELSRPDSPEVAASEDRRPRAALTRGDRVFFAGLYLFIGAAMAVLAWLNNAGMIGYSLAAAALAVGGYHAAGLAWGRRWRPAETAADTPAGAEDAADENEFQAYKSLSPLAIVTVVFGLASIMSIVTVVMLFVPLLGLLVGHAAHVSIRRRELETTGAALAKVGMVLCVGWLGVSAARHFIWPPLKPPKGYELVSFYELQPNKEAPLLPFSKQALSLHGKKVFVRGYVHPNMKRKNISKFVLVPDMKTCCFGGKPKDTDMIEVKLSDGLSIDYSTRRRGIGGTFVLHRRMKGRTDDLQGVYFELLADHVQ